MKPLKTSFVRALHAAAAIVVAAVAGPAPVAAQTVDIANSPLYGGRQAHPNVVVSTSVEFPTVGAAYLNVGYAAGTAYLGYFDNTKCYKYRGDSTSGYFYVERSADSNFSCTTAQTFAGNFLNWSTMSAIDEFRYAMTGGNRYSENGNSNGTVIERAYLPDGSVNGVPSFYALPSNFPRHSIGSYAGTNYIDNSPTSVSATDVLPNQQIGSLFPGASGAYITNCKTQVHFGTSGGGDCNNPDNNLGTFHVAVLVCDDNEGPSRTDLCLQYGGSRGKYKPVGQVQLNAARMRFAAFGYLMDRNSSGYTVPGGCDDGSSWNRCRYGGVLRAPMKYVGPTQYDANQVASTNTKAEINADGTLVADPEGNANTAGGSYSGFINFINRFGASGVYKRYDPAGEMFYEAVRYYQNLGPTPLATSGTVTNTTKDFFPVTTAWTDPILSICAANYIINLSDANTWDDTYLPGATGAISTGYGRPSTRPAEGGLDAYAWTNNIGVLESTTSSLVTDDVRPNLANIARQNTANNASWAVAGAAYWANVNDIRSDLQGVQTIKTISFDVAEASIDIHDRQLYLMGKYGGFSNTIDRTSDTYANPFWGLDPANPTNPAIRTNSEWIDSSGMPTNYLLASSPQKLINGLRSAFARINAQTGTLSGAALTSANLTFGSAGAYIATFDPAKWSGSVLFNSLSVDANGNLAVSTSPIWDAGALLTARCGSVAAASTVCKDNSNAATKRNIFTTVTLAGVRTAQPFTYASVSQDSAYLAALNKNPATNASDSLAQARINYLRGYRADEASALGFRLRDSAMGDIVNSGPIYEGPPSPAIGDSDYQTFFTTNVSRTPAVYVGSNDGMLHALRASDGYELFAYIPGYSYADLNDLTNPGYAHQVYVDTVPKVQEVKVNGTWKTVLVGASGAGAQGIFGLDVTDPTTFGNSKVLFEFADTDDADFPSVVSAPEIAKLWVSGTASAPVYRYFAVVTGYNKNRTTVNNRTDTNVSADTTNKGVLFLVALDHTLGTAWRLNTDYYKFTFPATNTAIANGLGPVTLLSSRSGDQSTAFMYFGDLQGNLWKFATNTGNPSTWQSVLGTSTVPLPLFVAQDGNGNRQPITARPELANGPYNSTLVFFGTGQYLGSSDLTLPGTVQSEYGLFDANPTVAISRSADLVARTATVSGSNVTITGTAFSYSGSASRKGWYVDFPSSSSLGERSVTKPAVRTGLLTFTTLTLSNDLCTPGNGYIYQVDALTGLPFAGATGNVAGFASTVGIPGPPRVVDLTSGGGITQATGELIGHKTQTTLVSGTSGKIGSFGTQVPIPQPPTQEINWREISNWNDQMGYTP